MKKHKFYVVKPITDNGEKAVLSQNRIIANTINETETSIMLDTNILIKIEKIVKNGNTSRHIRDYNLQKLVSLLKQRGSIAVSAGSAIMEMPPSRRVYAQYCFDEFTKVHAGNLINDPKGINEPPPLSTITSWRFDELEPDHQKAYALHYGSFLIMLIANEQHLNPEKKYRYFIDRIVDEFDLILSSVSEIAKLCFYNPTNKEEPEFKRLLKAIKGNFLEKPKSYDNVELSPSERMMQGCLNSTVDLFIMISATQSDTSGLDGIKQDTWIATSDGKLAMFAEYFSYTNLDGFTGAIAEIPRYPDQLNSEYWQKVDEYSRYLNNERRVLVFSDKHKLDVDKYLRVVKRLHAEIHDKHK